jgi:hypothetical protein
MRERIRFDTIFLEKIRESKRTDASCNSPHFYYNQQKKKKKEFDQTHISLDDGTVKFRLFSEEAIKWPC